MSKAGRKRQAGERYPSGELRPYETRQAGSPGAQVRRMFDAAKRGASNPRLGTAIGLLRMQDALSDRQFAAAESYAKLRGRYDVAVGMPRRSALSPAYGAVSSQSETDEQPRRDVLDEDDREKAVVRIKRQHEQMIAALCDEWPAGTIVDGKLPRAAASQAQALLDRVCVDDQHPSAWELPALCSALDGLIKHFRI